MKKRVVFVAAIFVVIVIVSIPILVSTPLSTIIGYTQVPINLYTDNYI